MRIYLFIFIVCTLLSCKKGKEAPPSVQFEKQKGRASALYLVAMNKMDLESLEAAERILLKSLEHKVPDDEVYFQFARVLSAKWELNRHAAVDPKGAMKAKPKSDKELVARIRKYFSEAIRLNPEEASYLREYANYLERSDQFEEAISKYKQFMKMKPNVIVVYERLGSCYLSLDQLDEAKSYYMKAIKTGVGVKGDMELRATVLEGLGRIYLQQGDSAEAERLLQKAIATGSEPGPLACSYHALGQLYSGLGKFKKSAMVVAKGADLEPGKPSMQLRAAVYYFVAYDFTSARKYIDRILEKEAQQYTEINNIKGYLLLMEQKYADAKDKFLFVKSRINEDTGAAVGLGHLAIINKDYKKALSLLEPHSHSSSNKLVGYPYLVEQMASLGMAWLHANQNKHTVAIKYFSQILSNNPSDLFALLGRGSSYNALGRLDEAEKSFKKVLALDENNQYGLAELGLVFLNRGDEKAAEAVFNKALAQGAQKYTCPYEGLGLVYMKQGKFAKAKRNFEKAIEINPDIEYKKFNELAKIYIKQGKVEEALSLLRKSVKNYPYDPEAKELIQVLQAVKRPKP